ncbi:MAG: PQQ-binding-like beta-propeller repeat protein [Bacteroidota bacterium]
MKKESARPNKLNLLPGIIIVILQWLLRYLLPALIPKAAAIGFLGGVACGLALVVWWLFFSHAARIERWGAIVLIIIVMYGTSLLLDKSIATANMGLMFIIFSIPVISLSFVIWAVLTRNLSTAVRRITMVVFIVVASGIWTLLRTNGMTGDGRHYLGWRWAETKEEILLTHDGNDAVLSLSGIVTADTISEWTGFRGANRDGIVKGIKINTDWSASPPVEIWRKPVGPGCSSFAVKGDRIYTQEQLGENETVSCYSLLTGNLVWKHGDKARFEESHAGPGPRSTPTIAGNDVYTLGATGILNVLDAINGSVIWSRNASSDAGVKVPAWGFTSSPLITGNTVIVALAGKMAAYDITTGDPVWFGPDGGSGYSSPQLVFLNGEEQVLLMSSKGAQSVEPETGRKKWEYTWEIPDRILQPSSIEGNDLLLSGENISICRVSVKREADVYKIKKLWESSDYKVNFNDFIIHKGYAYAFDGPYLTCLNLKDGKRMWRGARYRGFQILLADQDLLLILTEKGEVTLVSAVPEKFTELATIRVLNARTWSHPVLAGNILVVRNHEEMVAYRLDVRKYVTD